jgi:hypothetical protein
VVAEAKEGINEPALSVRADRFALLLEVAAVTLNAEVRSLKAKT